MVGCGAEVFHQMKERYVSRGLCELLVYREGGVAMTCSAGGFNADLKTFIFREFRYVLASYDCSLFFL